MASILQVQNVTNLNPSNIVVGVAWTWTDIPGMILNITPSSVASVIKISAVYSGDRSTTNQCYMQILRNGVAVGNGIPTTQPHAAYCRIFEFTTFQSVLYVDSPASTALLTYKFQCTSNGANTIYFNSDAINSYAGASCLVLEEIG